MNHGILSLSFGVVKSVRAVTAAESPAPSSVDLLGSPAAKIRTTLRSEVNHWVHAPGHQFSAHIFTVETPKSDAL